MSAWTFYFPNIFSIHNDHLQVYDITTHSLEVYKLRIPGILEEKTQPDSKIPTKSSTEKKAHFVMFSDENHVIVVVKKKIYVWAITARLDPFQQYEIEADVSFAPVKKPLKFFANFFRKN